MSLASPKSPPSPSNASRKRKNTALNDDVEESQKRDVCEDRENDGDLSRLEPVTFRPLPTSVYDKPFIFQPLLLLLRSQLPLSFLDTSTHTPALPADRLYSSSLPVLDNGSNDGEGGRWCTNVLLARLELDSALYVIERVRNGIYALCRLASWVKPKYLYELTPATTPDLILRKMGIIKENAHVRRASDAIAGITQAEDGQRPAKRVKPSTMAPSAIGGQVTTDTAPAIPGAKASPTTTNKKAKRTQPKMPEEQVKLQTSSEVVFATLVKQYLEALYWSKNSLAFFTKGPLSRARASFSVSTEEKMSIKDLRTFLRSMLLDVKSMDKKYRDKLPEMIKNFLPAALSEDEDAPPSGTKKRKSRKLKLGKDGVYPFEEDYVKRWWTADDSSPHRAHADDGLQELLKRKLADLRARETFAQIVLILEIMALEPPDPLPSEQSTEDAVTEDQPQKKRSKEKLLDLNLLLDLLLDKLSIWQSVEQDAATSQKKVADAVPSERPQDQDVLGSFCAEVVVPFYKSRLPLKAAEVVNKLSGQADSPKKPPKARPKPGDPVPRGQPAQKERRRLQKTISDTQAIFRPPSLVRSATGSFIKREASEVPLSAIPQLKESRPPSRSRQPSVQLQHLNRRQVDLSALSTASEAKLRRKANIEDELKDAIAALKKPNRGRAVKDYADASDQRVFASTNKRKQQPARRILQNVENVQVMATPRNARKFNALATKASEQEPRLDEMLPPSSSIVPASSIRPQNKSSGKGSASRDDQPFRKPSAKVAETPSPGPAKMTSFFPPALGATPDAQRTVSAFKIPSSAIKAMDRVTGIEQTPSKPRHKPLSLSANIFAPQIMRTPSKPRAPAFADTTTVQKHADIAEGAGAEIEQGHDSIYDALGWNDVDELA